MAETCEQANERYKRMQACKSDSERLEICQKENPELFRELLGDIGRNLEKGFELKL